MIVRFFIQKQVGKLTDIHELLKNLYGLLIPRTDLCNDPRQKPAHTLKIGPMIKRFLPYLFLITLFACKKDNDPINEPDLALPQFLLKTITWDIGITSTSFYTDSLLQHVTSVFQSAGGSVVYNWNGATLSELHDDRSMYKNLYDYDNNGRLVIIRNVPKTGSSSTGYTLEFKYNSANKVDSLTFFIINEAGKQPQGASSYHYNSAGELKEIITKSGNAIITHTIDQYSSLVSFNPCHYISPGLDENYTIYNYAVMRQLKGMNKLPAKVTRVVKSGSEQPYIDKVEEHIYTISNYRIDKVVSSITYPKVPSSNSTMESVYSYY
jgi:hypothetical protein